MSDFSGQTALFDDFNDAFCQQQCFAFAKCGGGYATAPCQCAWRSTSSRYLQCKECPLICLRRLDTVNGLPVGSARQQYRDGLDLRDLSVSQRIKGEFPLLIPLRTSNFPVEGGVLPLRWAAVDATQLKERILTKASPNPKFATPEEIRTFLRVSNDCRLMAVMNAQDKILERVWEMDDRIGQFQLLASYGFELSTGTTFSVTELTVESTPVPRFHNLVMQRRHHRMVGEIQKAGLMAVPNLYWLDDREEDLWVWWLLQNPAVRFLTRDFTRTRQGVSFHKKMNALLGLLNKAGRTFHVFLVGPGPAVAAAALRRLAEYGHSGTIITSDPIMQGMYGKLYNGQFKATSFRTKPKHELVLDNIEIFETHLLEAVANTEVARVGGRNLVLTPVH